MKADTYPVISKDGDIVKLCVRCNKPTAFPGVCLCTPKEIEKFWEDESVKEQLLRKQLDELQKAKESITQPTVEAEKKTTYDSGFLKKMSCRHCFQPYEVNQIAQSLHETCYEEITEELQSLRPSVKVLESDKATLVKAMEEIKPLCYLDIPFLDEATGKISKIAQAALDAVNKEE